MTDSEVDDQGRQPRRRRFATYNTFNLYKERRGPELARYEQVAEVIAGLDADVVAIQEIRTDHAPAAGDLLARIAKAAGMTAEVTPAWWTEDDAQNPTYAIAPGAHTFHTGLMWKPDAGIEPDLRSLRTWGAGTFFHSLIRLTLRLDGIPVGFASYHAAPFGRQMRADQAERVLAAVTRPMGPVLLGGDMNAIGAAWVTGPGGQMGLYDPDPYADIEWFGDLVYQCDWRYEPDGRRVFWADRRPTDIFISGGLHDVAATLKAPFQPSTGHHRLDEFGQRGVSRRIDQVYATANLVPGLHDYEVVDTPLARQASDHLPVLVSFAP